MTQINLSDDVYTKLDSIKMDYGFESVDEFVSYVFEMLLVEIDTEALPEKKQEISKQEEEVIKERLKNLGYM